MAALQGLAHELHVAHTLEAVVRAAARELDQVRDQVAADGVRVHEVGHAELAGDGLTLGVDVHAHDLVGAGEAGALDHVEPDAAEPENDDVRARFDLRGVDDRADARRHAAADVADLVEGGVLPDLCERDLGHDRELREGRAAHVVVNLLPADGETTRAVGHQALPLRGADRRTQVRLPAQARFAAAALRRVQRDDVVPLLDRRHARTDVDHDARAFMPEDDREQALGIAPGAGELIRVAHPRGLDLDEHLARARAFEVDGLDHQGFTGFVGDCGACFHGRRDDRTHESGEART